MSEHVNRTYRVPDYPYREKEFDRLADARAAAEEVMTGRHDDDYILIEAMDEGESFFEPYASIVREGERFVMKR